MPERGLRVPPRVRVLASPVVNRPQHARQLTTEQQKPARRKVAGTGHAIELREACIVAARDVIAEQGVEGLSLRDVARRLGVSHQAPYRHYPSRDHLLAEVMRRCFQRFAAHLDARPRFDAPEEDLASLGMQYLAYAQQNPLEYRLMFSTPWPRTGEEAGLARDAAHAFDVLRGVLQRLHGDSPESRTLVELDALHVWSTMHGLAGVMNGPCIAELDISRAAIDGAVQHAMMRLGAGLGVDPPPAAPSSARRSKR